MPTIEVYEEKDRLFTREKGVNLAEIHINNGFETTISFGIGKLTIRQVLEIVKLAKKNEKTLHT